MRRFLATVGLFFAYAAGVAICMTVLHVGDYVAPGVLAMLFSLASLRLVRRGWLFVILSVFVLTVTAPVAVLVGVARPLEGSYVDAFLSVVRNILGMEDHGLAVVTPLISAALALAIGIRWLGPNNSSKPTPLRGAA